MSTTDKAERLRRGSNESCEGAESCDQFNLPRFLQAKAKRSENWSSEQVRA